MIQRIQMHHVVRKVNDYFCTDLQRTTLDAINYKTYSDATNQLVPLEISSESHRDYIKIKITNTNKANH